MNYEKIHNSIIEKARNRVTQESLYYESHHIIPMCEGGALDGETVKLTLREHMIIHKLRYFITGVAGNLYAYNLMKYGEAARRKNSSLAAKMTHIKAKKENPDLYRETQKRRGIAGGQKSLEEKSGFLSMSEEELSISRASGRKTLIDNKIGMFSDEYRKKHRDKMKKKVMINGIIYSSCIEAASKLGVSPGTITNRIKEGRAVVIEAGIYSRKGTEYV